MADKNLTGEQIQQILDMFLYKALEPIIKRSRAFDDQIVYILGLITRNRKRKLSSIPREEAIAFLSKALITSFPEEKLNYFRAARIERNFIHMFIQHYLKRCEGYEIEYQKYLTAKGIQRKLKSKRLDVIAEQLKTDRRSLYVISLNSKQALDSFYDYRMSVLNQYVKHAGAQAKSFMQTNNKQNYDFFDFRQSILKSILVGIDKYDSSKGALTSYINWWILNAQTCNVSDYEYGIAYTVPQGHKRKIANKESSDVNYSVSLDTLLTKDDDEDNSLHTLVSDGSDLVEDIHKEQQSKNVQYLVKCLDKSGIVRLSLDIGEFFSRKEYRRMKMLMKKQKL